MSAAQLPCVFLTNLCSSGKQGASLRCAGESSFSLPAFLTEHSGVPYTTVLTIGHGTAVPLLGFHCERLLFGARHLLSKMHTPHATVVREALLTLLSEVAREFPPGAGELQYVPALVPSGDGLQLLVHASHTADPRLGIRSLTIECRGSPRSDPGVKNTAWFTERKPLEVARATEASETILMGTDRDGCQILLEGLISNIFVITRDLCVHTAPADVVLAGSLRQAVLDACAELGVAFCEKAVRTKDYPNFEAAFLTNARKLLVPIDTILLPYSGDAGECPCRVQIPCGEEAMELMGHLRQAVCWRLESSATSIARAQECG